MSELEDVAQGVRELEGRIDGFAQEGNVPKLAKTAHGLAKVALRALEDAQTAQREAEQAVKAYQERQQEGMVDTS